MDDITDSMPAPTWLGFFAKFARAARAAGDPDGWWCSCAASACSSPKGFTQIELGALPVRALRAAAAGLLPDRACSRWPSTRWSTTSTSATSSCCCCSSSYVAAAGLRLRGPALPLREPARRRLLRPQRLRALPAGGVLVPAVLGRVRACCCSCWRTRCGCAGATAAGAGALRAAAARMTPAAWAIAGVGGAVFVATGALDLLQHARR